MLDHYSHQEEKSVVFDQSFVSGRVMVGEQVFRLSAMRPASPGELSRLHRGRYAPVGGCWPKRVKALVSDQPTSRPSHRSTKARRGRGCTVGRWQPRGKPTPSPSGWNASVGRVV